MPWHSKYYVCLLVRERKARRPFRLAALKKESRAQLFSKFFPVHDRVARSISPSLTMLVPLEM